MRRRARHRLIGAAVLVLIGIVGFPVLFDTQPRPIAVDIPIEIPDRNKVKPLGAPAAPISQTSAAGPVTADAGRPLAPVSPEKTASSAPAAAPPAAPSRPEIATESKADAKADPRAEPKPAVPAKTEAKADDGAKAQALLEGRAVEVAAAGDVGRFVVQVGAFADAAKARETRLKVERAGLKTYTHEAETKEGKRIRVRVGPFTTRAEADKAAGRIKDLDLPAAILTL